MFHGHFKRYFHGAFKIFHGCYKIFCLSGGHHSFLSIGRPCFDESTHFDKISFKIVPLFVLREKCDAVEIMMLIISYPEQN